jgi:hypothetical protein
MRWDETTWLESASPTVLVLCRPFNSVKCCLSVSEVTCILDGKRPYNHLMYFMLPKSVGISVKINFYAFTFFFLRLYYYLYSISSEPNRHFTLKIDSDVHDSFVSLV